MKAKENSIKEDILNIEKYIELVTEKNYCECNELNEICSGSQCYGSRNVAYSMKRILSDYKKILKENEILKEEKEQAWEEWNNLEQGSYETEQKLKQEIEELKETLKCTQNSWYEDTQKIEEMKKQIDLDYECEIALNNRIMDLENADKKWEDKIKAKIEEVKDGTYDAKIILESLLEKK